jgi:two-component system, chemotaxis family, protein-glutamate methylesterase/glutaminase
MRSIKILIADDSALIRSILKQLFRMAPDLVVVGEASNGEQAVARYRDLAPDVIIMDVSMPVMDGLEATRRITDESRGRVAVMIFSNALDAEVSYRAMRSGAAEAVSKPEIDRFNEPAYYEAFFEKIRALAGATLAPERVLTGRVRPRNRAGGCRMVVMGASTGGPVAVRTILSALPGDLPIGIALVQHMERGFDAGYARWLNEATPLSVHLAGDPRFILRPGEVVIAPVDHHLKVDGDRLILDNGPRVLNQKPSVDVLFQSAAARHRDRLIGVLLTGMGRDGAVGCRAIVSGGGVTLIQDEGTSAIFGMPKAAIDLGGASHVLPLSEIPNRILALLREGGGRR